MNEFTGPVRSTETFQLMLVFIESPWQLHKRLSLYCNFSVSYSDDGLWNGSRTTTRGQLPPGQLPQDNCLCPLG